MRKCILCLLLLSDLSARGQRASQPVRDFLDKIRQAYNHPDHLTFRVAYTYANDNQLNQPLDSLSGEVEMDGNRSRMLVGGTEILRTDEYSMEVLPDPKLIYLSKAPSNGPMDPIATLDTILAHLSGVQVSLDGPVLTVQFPPGSVYTRVRMVVDPATGYLEEADYGLHTNGLVSQDQLNTAVHPGPYQDKGQVSVRFYGYAHGGFEEALLDPSRIITRTGNHIVPTEAYKNYQIFFASRTY